MGRHAGFLTAAAAAWRLDEDSGPHLLYVPERAFSVPRFIDDVRAHARPHKRCIVAVSEGVSTEDGRALVESLVPPDRLERDAHGNIKLSGSDLGWPSSVRSREGLPGKRARVDALGYMPRGYIGAINEVDAQEAFDAGVFAVEAADAGRRLGRATIRRRQDGAADACRLPNVAGKTRHMPDDFLLPDVQPALESGHGLSEPADPGEIRGRPAVCVITNLFDRLCCPSSACRHLLPVNGEKDAFISDFANRERSKMSPVGAASAPLPARGERMAAAR